MSRLVVLAGALAGLAVTRALPETGAGLYLRLAAATLVVLLPGALVAEAVGRRSVSATLACSLAGLTAALAVMFSVGGSLWLGLGLYGLVGLVALPFALRRPRPPRPRWSVLVAVLGIVFGVLLWHVADGVGGDALFHLARVRKLESFDSLSLRTLDEFRDGGLHPGYAFPLWHGFLGLVARLAGVDPSSVVQHEASVLAPVAFLVVYEAGLVLFRSAAAGFAVLAAQVGLIALAPGHGGAYTHLALPATASRQLLVPAALALAFASLRDSWPRSLLASVAAAGLAIALVHPPYALFLCIPLLGFLAARVVLARSLDLSIGAAVAAIALPAAGVLVWLLPIVRETASHNPADVELRRGLRHYASQLDVHSEHSYGLAPEVFGRGGAVAVAALALVPLAAFAPRRRWAAFVLGGSLAMFALLLPTFVFPHFAELVSLSQARRAAGFVPFAFAFAGGAAVLAGALRFAVLPVALGAGIALQLAWPGDFGYTLRHGGPPLATWIAAIGGAAALLAAAIVRRREDIVWRPGALTAAAAALFVLPVAVHGFARWSPAAGADGYGLTPGLLGVLRDDVPRGAVVFSDLETSYRISAYAPLYIAAAPPAHVADTRANRPAERRRDVIEFFRTGSLAIPRRYGAQWIVVDRSRYRLKLRLAQAYADGRYVLYRLASSR